METIFYPDEIRSPAGLSPGLEADKLHENEVKMAVSLIDNLSVDFEPGKYHDEYRQALRELIDAKIVGKEVVNAPAVSDKGKVVDLMEALQASVKLAEESRKQNEGTVEGKKKRTRKAKTGS